LNDEFEFTVIYEATSTCVRRLVEIGRAVLEMKRRMNKKKKKKKTKRNKKQNKYIRSAIAAANILMHTRQ
jgi:hypothetical protein